MGATVPLDINEITRGRDRDLVTSDRLPAIQRVATGGAPRAVSTRAHGTRGPRICVVFCGVVRHDEQSI